LALPGVDRHLLRAALGADGRLREVAKMNVMLLFAGAVALFLLVYLIAALIDAENL
jgi:hypothetical protein